MEEWELSLTTYQSIDRQASEHVVIFFGFYGYCFASCHAHLSGVVFKRMLFRRESPKCKFHNQCLGPHRASFYYRAAKLSNVTFGYRSYFIGLKEVPIREFISRIILFNQRKADMSEFMR